MSELTQKNMIFIDACECLHSPCIDKFAKFHEWLAHTNNVYFNDATTQMMTFVYELISSMHRRLMLHTLIMYILTMHRPFIYHCHACDHPKY